MVRRFRNQVDTMKVGISVAEKNKKTNECVSIRKELDSIYILKAIVHISVVISKF